MKKLNKKKIGILILLLIVIIIEIKAFTDSRASKLLEITAIVNDNSGYLSSSEIPLEASSEGKAGYVVTLPNIVGDNVVSKYIVDKKDIEETKESKENNKNSENKNANNSKAKDQQNQENKENKETQEKKPGEKIYLTEEETKAKKINLNVEYDKKEKNKQTLYNKVLEIMPNNEEENKNSDNKKENTEEIKNKDLKITVKGYMPKDAYLRVEEVKKENLSENTKEYLSEKTSLDIAYDIKIIYNEKEYEPGDADFLAFALKYKGCDKGQRNNPKGTSQFDCSSNLQSLFTVSRTGTYH